MKKTELCLAAILSLNVAAHGQLIIADNFNMTGSGTGFGLNAGVNSGINPPTTRLTGSAADNLRYINRNLSGKPDSSYLLGGDIRLRVNSGASSGRTSFSADGTTAFDFGSALGIGGASPSSPIEYDINISMDNNAAGTQRMSFGLGTIESDATTWDFGIQLYKAVGTDNFYTVGKRIDTGSSGLGADLNASILAMTAGSAGTEVSFVIRVTDAGSETTGFNSRVRLSQDGGSTWFYDTLTDLSLTSGWRLDGAGRFFSFDVAGGNSSFVTYDDFSVNVITPVPEPSTYALASLSGVALLWLRQRRQAKR